MPNIPIDMLPLLVVLGLVIAVAAIVLTFAFYKPPFEPDEAFPFFMVHISSFFVFLIILTIASEAEKELIGASSLWDLVGNPKLDLLWMEYLVVLMLDASWIMIFYTIYRAYDYKQHLYLKPYRKRVKELKRLIEIKKLERSLEALQGSREDDEEDEDEEYDGASGGYNSD